MTDNIILNFTVDWVSFVDVATPDVADPEGVDLGSGARLADERVVRWDPILGPPAEVNAIDVDA